LLAACLAGGCSAVQPALVRLFYYALPCPSPTWASPALLSALPAAAVKAELPPGTSQKEVMQALSQKYSAHQGSSQAGVGPSGSGSSSGAVSSLLDKMNLQA
jgi:hypothetical protein